MKYFGTITSFDTIKGHGQIKPETGGNDLRFETSAIMWDKSYDVGQSPSATRAL